jgi:hypothetical protein
MKTLRFKNLILVVCFLAYGFSSVANDTIRFTWQGSTSGLFSVRLDAVEQIVVDWGDGSAIDTLAVAWIDSLWIDSMYVFGEHVYLDSLDYAVTVSMLSSNASFKGLSFAVSARLTDLDVSRCPALEELFCSNNLLTRLDLSANAALVRVFCSNNHLQLSDLYNASVIMGHVTMHNTLGTQTLGMRTLNFGDTVDFASQALFNGITTNFNVERNGSPAAQNDYAVHNGIITFTNVGNYKITMTNAAILSDPYAKVIAEFVLTYAVPVTGITVNPSRITLNVGDSVLVTASVVPPNATNQNIRMFYGDSLIIWVNNSIVYALSEGSAFIDFYSEDGGFIGSCIITVVNQYRADISGTILHQDSTPVTSGFIHLYKTHPQWQYNFSASVSVANDGSYLFPQVDEGDYLLKFFPDSLENALPTYYGNTTLWNLASIVTVADSLPIQNVDIMILPIIPLNGSSFISGYVGQDSSRQKSLSHKSVSQPAEDVDVYLQRQESGDSTIVAQTLTDADGYFEFRNVPAGRYRVLLDVPGLELSNPQIIDVNDGDTIQNIEYAIMKDGIENNTDNVGIEEWKIEKGEWKIYPNPTNGQLRMENGELTIDNVTVYDVVGRSVGAYPCGRPENTIDVSHLEKGMYYLKINNKVMKFVKQ